MRVTGLDFVSYPTQDLERSKTFYSEVIGLRMLTPPGDAWPEFDLGDGSVLALIEPEKIGQPFSPVLSGIALHVENVETATEEMRARGITIHHAMDSGVCKMTFLSDPDGNALILHHRYAPEEIRCSPASDSSKA